MAQLMAIVNLTPDSFYEPSRVWVGGASSPVGTSEASSSPTCSGISAASAAELAIERILSFACAGASIIDLGAVSTRPGAADVSARTEWSRLAPILRALAALQRGRSQEDLGKVKGVFGEGQKKGSGPSPNRLRTFPISVSIDTTRAAIVRKAYKVIGPFIVNDISSGEEDPEMLPTVAKLDLPYIAMHKRGNPQTMNGLCDYPEGVVVELIRYFSDFSERAEKLGIHDWILDPGLGFAKTNEQCWEILERLEELQIFGRPILIGAADKRFTKAVPDHIFAEFGPKVRVAAPDGFSDTVSVSGNTPDGTDIAHAVALAHGADILRVHAIPNFL